jgi:hypothetical protein
LAVNTSHFRGPGTDLSRAIYAFSISGLEPSAYVHRLFGVLYDQLVSADVNGGGSTLVDAIVGAVPQPPPSALNEATAALAACV